MVAVDQGLVVHGRVQRGEQGLLDADLAVQQVEHRYDGVGGARRVGHQPFAAVELAVVDPEHDGGIDILGAVARMGEQQAGTAGTQEARQFAAAAVLAGTFHQQVDSERLPVDLLGRVCVRNDDRLVTDDQRVFGAVHCAMKTSVGGVEAGEVGDAGEVGRLVDRHDAEVLAQPGLVQGAQVAAADPSITVDRDAKGGARNRGGRQGVERGHGVLEAGGRKRPLGPRKADILAGGGWPAARAGKKPAS